ncbi:EF-hand domain-containing protein [Rhodopirellula europaea]|uniref:Secreted protein containing EF hand domain protein n=1 Tax=Rhodopirellula europaea 6C TaxID=1263867 RepID=M2AL69_9BACT|nr:EF-hand domain-containing protein [Rhodopirellula europaea]EMB17865.1 secreted protein containing EF hand domain protein [Rhodopirellula europaea 6C]
MKALTQFSFVVLTVAGMCSAVAQPPERGDREGRGGRSGADRGQRSPVERLMRLDKDEDGKLTEEEVGDSRLKSLITRADKDKDGVVTREELEAMVGSRELGDGARGPRGNGDRGPRGDGDRGPRGGGDRGPRGEGRGPEDGARRGPRDGDGDRGPRADGDRGPRGQEGRGPRGEGDRGRGPGPGFGGPARDGEMQGRRGPGGPPQVGQVLPAFVQEHMSLSDEQREAIAKLQAKVDAELKEILSEEQLHAMRRGPGQGLRSAEGHEHHHGDHPEGADRPSRPDRPERGDRPGRPGRRER